MNKNNRNRHQSAAAIVPQGAAPVRLSPIVHHLHDRVARSAIAGNRAALAELARVLHAEMVEHAHAHLRRFDCDAEDVVQDVFVEMLEGTLRQPPRSESAVVWLLLTYDPQVDASYVYLAGDARREIVSMATIGDRRPVRQVPAVDGVSFDLDASGRILGVEILDASRLLRPETIEQAEGGGPVLEPLDLTVLAATQGDAIALESLVAEAGPLVLREARRALGGLHAQDTEDVAQDFWLELAEGRLVFPLIRGAAKAWIKRRVRHLAAEHLRMGGER